MITSKKKKHASLLEEQRVHSVCPAFPNTQLGNLAPHKTFREKKNKNGWENDGYITRRNSKRTS